MKVLHVYRTYFPDSQGGLEEAIRQLCRGTTALGVENRIFTLSPISRPDILRRAEATVYRFPRSFEIASCSFSLRCLAGFRDLVDWADIVHYQFPWPFADLLHFGAAVRKPTLLSYQSDIVRQQGWLMHLYRPLMRCFLQSVDALVATSPNYAASSPVLPKYRHKLHIIPIGLDSDCYPQPNQSQEDAVRQRYGTGYFLFVGVLRYYKGLHLLLEAACASPFSIVIVGSGPLEKRLKRQVANLGLANVQFTGYVSDATKAALYHHARALVFPSHLRSEAFGVTLVEGALYGKPLISAEISSGTTYINQHRQTGLVVPANDPIALRHAMLQLYHDADLSSQLGLGARQRYLQLFTGRQAAIRYFQLYQEVLARSQVAVPSPRAQA